RVGAHLQQSGEAGRQHRADLQPAAADQMPGPEIGPSPSPYLSNDAAIRARIAASGMGGMAARRLSRICSGLLVPGMMQVTAGWPRTYYSRICARLWQPISPAQPGKGLPESLRMIPPPPKGL